jgi:hypothetical protein
MFKYLIVFILLFRSLLFAGIHSEPVSFSDTGKVNKNIKSEIYTLKSGKSFTIFQEPESEYLYDVRIVGNGFLEKTDTILFDEIEKVDTVVIADLDNDGFEELYIFTRGFEPGDYDHVFGVMSAEDKSYDEIIFPSIKPEDITMGSMFEGYNGKDVYKIKDNVLERTFPVHKQGDTYENPELGYRTIYYTIEKTSYGNFYKIRN